MLDFKPLTDVNLIKNYLNSSKISFCDLTVGVRYLWRDAFNVDYAIFDNTLIMKETCRDYKNAFYFPIGDNISGALSEIENYCKSSGIPLKFCYIDEERKLFLENRYPSVNSYYLREWSDYIYPIEQFVTYSGKKLSGQRNHVNKFKSLYPDHTFSIMSDSDADDIISFYLSLNEKPEHNAWTYIEERNKLKDYIKNFSALDQIGGILKVGGKIVGFTIGEIIGDTLYSHVEKADRNFEGAYPTLAQEFARAFYNENLKFINREEDCGDEGLRKSKLQYHPSEIKNKNIIEVFSVFDKLPKNLELKTERLTVETIKENDKEDYKNLYLDENLNMFWGYDYREDLKDNLPTADYFFSFQNGLKDKREEYSFAVKSDGKMIGELVLYNFDFFGGAEIGFRFFKDYQGKGYAIESSSSLIKYAAENCGLKTLYSRCFIKNEPSFKLIKKLGLSPVSESQTHYFFKREL